MKGSQDWSPAGFNWQPGLTPFSTTTTMLACIGIYLTFIFVLKTAVRSPVTVPKIVPAIHNLVLCLGSLAMFCGALYESSKEMQRTGTAVWLFCLPQETSIQGPLYFWSYCYYLSKFYEFIDTVLLVLKGKQLTVLHVFHHSIVVVMAWLWLEAAQSLQQLALLVNTGVHVIMYYYYFLCCIDRPPKWKQLVTNVQILQFVSSFGLSVPFWILSATTPGCSGFGAMVFNAVFNAALLVLFINFHRQNYRRKGRKAS